MVFSVKILAASGTTYLVNRGVCSFTWSALSVSKGNHGECSVPSFSNFKAIQHQAGSVRKVAIATYLHVVHLYRKGSSGEAVSSETVGGGEKGIVEGIRVIYGRVRATKLKRRVTAVLEQLSPTYCQPSCEPEIADNVKFWPTSSCKDPIPSQR